MDETTQFRFDDIQRTERYFTATLLPALLFHDNFRGLEAFLELVESRAKSGRDKSGAIIDSVPPLPAIDRDTIELITEFHITRDLRAAGHNLMAGASSDDDDASTTTPEIPVRLDVPDLVIVVDDQLVVCEGKYFGSFNLNSLNSQLRSQRNQILVLFQAHSTLSAYRHVAVLPFVPTTGVPDCDAVFTWRELADLACNVMGSSHYVSRRLCAGDGYYQKLSGPAEPGHGVLGQLSLSEALDRCVDSTAPIWIGLVGGKNALENRPLAELQARPWKWRTSLDGATKSNWITCQDFVSVMQARLAGATPQSAPSGNAARWDTCATLDDVLQRCAS